MTTEPTTETDPWAEAAMDLYHLNADELRTKEIETIAETIWQYVHGRYFMEDTGTEDLAEVATAVLDAITPLIETTVRQSCSSTAFGEANEHTTSCHAFATAERIALAIADGCGADEFEGDRGPCTEASR